MNPFSLDDIDVDQHNAPEDFEPTMHHAFHRYKITVSVTDMNSGLLVVRDCQNYVILSDIDMNTPAVKRGIFQSVLNSFVNLIVKNLP